MAYGTDNRAKGPRPVSTPYQPMGWGDLGMEITATILRSL